MKYFMEMLLSARGTALLLFIGAFVLVLLGKNEAAGSATTIACLILLFRAMGT
jgi:hypothetical protein